MPAQRYSEIAAEVQEICRRYGIPYNSGSLPKQFGTVVRKIVRLAVPPRDRSDVKPKERDLVAA
jgi:linoleoyl-CoA desaturase